MQTVKLPSLDFHEKKNVRTFIGSDDKTLPGRLAPNRKHYNHGRSDAKTNP